MKKDITITALPREARGKNEARRLRARGMAPAVLYGAGGDSIAVAVNPVEINRILHSGAGHNTIFDVRLGDVETVAVMLADWQNDPVKDNLLHVDLKRIDLTKRIVVKIPVHPQGEPRGVKEQGGLFEIVTRDIEVECLPEEIVEAFNVDVRELLMGQNVRVAEIPLIGSMKLISPGETVICHVVAARVVAAAETAAVEGAAVPGAAEPEIIKKGKKEEEAEEKEKKKK